MVMKSALAVFAAACFAGASASAEPSCSGVVNSLHKEFEKADTSACSTI